MFFAFIDAYNLHSAETFLWCVTQCWGRGVSSPPWNSLGLFQPQHIFQQANNYANEAAMKQAENSVSACLSVLFMFYFRNVRRALQLSCRLMSILIGSHAVSFTRPLLSVDVSVCVCLCVGNFDAKYLRKLSDLFNFWIEYLFTSYRPALPITRRRPVRVDSTREWTRGKKNDLYPGADRREPDCDYASATQTTLVYIRNAARASDKKYSHDLLVFYRVD